MESKGKSKNIKLFPNQQVHCDRLIKILNKWPVALDFSMMGTGKTYTSSFISKLLNFKHIVVICPVSVHGKWEFMKNEFGINIDNIISFCSLRSVKDHQPKHGLLSREEQIEKIIKKGIKKTANSKANEDSINGIGAFENKFDTELIDKAVFKCTELYLKYISEGTLLIIDEIQNIKNINSQFECCHELLNPIIGEQFKNKKLNNGNLSRAILLSGSPIDKKEQIINMMKLLNIMTHSNLSNYIPHSKKHEWKGFKDIIDFATFIDPSVLNIIPPQGDGSNEEYISIIYDIFQRSLKPELSSCMIPLVNEFTPEKKNGYYNISLEDYKKIETAVETLKITCNYDDRTGKIEFKGTNCLSTITKMLMVIESAKLDTMVRIVNEKIKSNANTKIVLCVNYTSSIDYLKTKLAKYSPQILNGSVSSTKRETIMNMFQEPNIKCKLIIGNLSVCSTGIDLDDQNGNHPRFCLVNPNYSTITLYQLSHRFHRQNTKSNATIHFMYSKNKHELPILSALANKSVVMKETTSEQVDAGILFPCDFQSFIEE